MKILFFIFISLSIYSQVVRSGETEDETQEIKKIRNEALALYKKGQVKEAADKLEHHCGGQNQDDEVLLQAKRWCYSDYMLYLYKSDQSEKCIKKMAWAAYPPFASENQKLEDAFDHNFELCRSSRLKQYGEEIKAEKCNLKESKLSNKAVLLPVTLLKSDSESACLDFSYKNTCPEIFLYEKKKTGGQIKKTKLKISESKNKLMGNESECCNIENIQLTKKNEKIFIWLQAQGRVCDEQVTAYSETNKFYLLKNNHLKEHGEVSIGYH